MFNIQIVNYFATNSCVAEINYNNIQWAEISYKNNNLIATFFPHPVEKDWQLPFQESIESLEEEKNRLLRSINITKSLFPPIPETIEEINQQGDEILNEILRHPNRKIFLNRFGGMDIFDPDGRGVRYSINEEFEGFLQYRGKNV